VTSIIAMMCSDMPKPSKKFAQNVLNALTSLVLHGKIPYHAFSSSAKCLCAFSRKVQDLTILYKSLSTFYTYAKARMENHTLTKSELQYMPRILASIGAFCRYHDFDDEQYEGV